MNLISLETLGGIPESAFCENSEFVNPEMRETPSFQFQKERYLNSGSVTAVTYSVNLTCSLAGLPEETLSLTELSDSGCPFLLSPIMLKQK